MMEISEQMEEALTMKQETDKEPQALHSLAMQPHPSINPSRSC